MDEKLLPALASTDPLVLPSPDQPPTTTGLHSSTSASDDLSLLAHMTGCGSADLGQAQSHGPGELPEDGPFKIQSPLADISSIAEAENQARLRAQEAAGAEYPEGEGQPGAEGEAAGGRAGDALSTTSDTERSDDGKEMKKIQTTATTQVCVCLRLGRKSTEMS